MKSSISSGEMRWNAKCIAWAAYTLKKYAWLAINMILDQYPSHHKGWRTSINQILCWKPLSHLNNVLVAEVVDDKAVVVIVPDVGITLQSYSEHGQPPKHLDLNSNWTDFTEV